MNKEVEEMIVKMLPYKNSAFPSRFEVENQVFLSSGLSKREFFAAMAVQGAALFDHPSSIIAERAKNIADALMEELK